MQMPYDINVWKITLSKKEKVTELPEVNAKSKKDGQRMLNVSVPGVFWNFEVFCDKKVCSTDLFA